VVHYGNWFLTNRVGTIEKIKTVLGVYQASNWQDLLTSKIWNSMPCYKSNLALGAELGSKNLRPTQNSAD